MLPIGRTGFTPDPQEKGGWKTSTSQPSRTNLRNRVARPGEKYSSVHKSTAYIIRQHHLKFSLEVSINVDQPQNHPLGKAERPHLCDLALHLLPVVVVHVGDDAGDGGAHLPDGAHVSADRLPRGSSPWGRVWLSLSNRAQSQLAKGTSASACPLLHSLSVSVKRILTLLTGHWGPAASKLVC